MKIITANPTGLCFGVKRAIDTLETELAKQKKVYAIGSPIHNPQEIERLRKIGLVVVEDVEEVPDNSAAFIRAHGVTPMTIEKLRTKNAKIIDGTCPFVKTAQERAKKLSQEGYLVIILGDETHPEVKGILGYIDGDAVVIGDIEHIPNTIAGKRCGLISQTTQRLETFSELVAHVLPMSPEIKVYNTICRATLARQQSVRDLTELADGIIILGGRNSANTKKLAEISSGCDVDTLWIEHAGELNGEWTQNKKTIGIAAGGSTPDWLINKLILKLQEM